LDDNWARMPLKPRSLPRTMTTPLPHIQLHSSFAISNRSAKRINLDTRPKALGARSVRELGRGLFVSQNAGLPFLPEMGKENQADMCLTPPAFQSLARFSSPPVLQRSAESNSPVPFLPVHSGLFIPDDF
jgi:hypothetical protein